MWKKQQGPEICLGKVQGIISYPDSSGCIIPHEGNVYKVCVQSVLTYGTETRAIKEANLQFLKPGEDRTDDGLVRWMFGVSLKDRKRSVDFSLLGVHSVDEVVRRGRLRWFGHVERKSGDDWVLACGGGGGKMCR